MKIIELQVQIMIPVKALMNNNLMNAVASS